MHCNGSAMLMRQSLQSSVASHNQKSTPQTRAFPSVFLRSWFSSSQFSKFQFSRFQFSRSHVSTSYFSSQLLDTRHKGRNHEHRKLILLPPPIKEMKSVNIRSRNSHWLNLIQVVRASTYRFHQYINSQQICLRSIGILTQFSLFCHFVHYVPLTLESPYWEWLILYVCIVIFPVTYALSLAQEISHRSILAFLSHRPLCKNLPFCHFSKSCHLGCQVFLKPHFARSKFKMTLQSTANAKENVFQFLQIIN